jgi:PAS domain S-box-containing protein
MKNFKMPLLRRKYISKDVVEIELDAFGCDYEFMPGQHCQISIPNFPKDVVVNGHQRVFSIVSEPASGKITFAFRARGEISEFKKTLLSLPLGSDLQVSEASGTFTLSDKNVATYVFIAAGVGITAFMSKLRIAEKTKSAQKIILMWSIASESEAPYLDEIRRMSINNPNFSLITRTTSVDGRIDKKFIISGVPDYLNARWQVAGPKEAVLNLHRTLLDIGVSDDYIQREMYSGYEHADEKTYPKTKELPLLSRGVDDKDLQGLLDAFNTVAIISETDSDGNIIFVNDKFVEVSKYSRDELIGQNHRILKSGHHPPKFFRKLWDTITSGKVWRGEIKNRAKDGTFYWVDTSIAPVFDKTGRLSKYVSVRFVITDKKKADEELMIYRQSLESMVEEKTKEITSTNDILKREIQRRQKLEDQLQARAKKLAESDKKKDEFIAVLSHELRNPMTPIVMSLDLIRSSTIKDQKLLSYIEIIDRQVKNMNRIMNDLLDVSRVLRGKIELRPQKTKVQDVVMRSIETTRSIISECGHDITVDLEADDIVSMIDPVRMEQVVVNLINNAAKYTHNGGVIKIKLRSDSKNYYLSITDNGIGISDEDIKKIFSLFVQADNSLTRKRGGLGIGLALSHSIVKMHGGNIKAESLGPGKGSTFVVTLPISDSRTPRLHRKKNAGAHSTNSTVFKDLQSNHKVLIVDDVPEITSTLSTLLEASGFDTFSANDGITGVEKAVRIKPDFVLLDIAMPGMDGYETLSLMKQNIELADTSYIAITGFGQKSDIENSREAGFDAHLVKPVTLELLQDTLVKLGAEKH